MGLPRLKLALLVAVAAGFTFLNPWLLAFAVGGYAGGWLIRRLFHAVLDRRGAIARAPYAPVARILAALVSVTVFVAGLLTTHAVYKPGGKEPKPGPGIRETWTAPYRAELVYANGFLHVREQFKLSPRLRDKTGLGGGTILGDSRWARVGLVNGELVVEHRQTPVAPHVRTWPLRTPLHVSLTTYRLSGGDVIVPAESSTADMTGPKDFVASTDPSTAETTELPGNRERRRITLVDSGSFDRIDTIDLQANSPLARNPVVKPLLGASLWTPLLGITAIATAILRDWLTTRIKRLLRLEKRAAPDAPAHAST